MGYPPSGHTMITVILFVLCSTFIGCCRCQDVVHDVVVDVVPHHSATGGAGDFVKDPTSSKHIGDPSVITDPTVHNYVPDVVPDFVPSSHSVVQDIVPSSQHVVSNVVQDVVPDLHQIVPDIVPHSRQIVRDVVPDSSHIVRDVVSDSSHIVHDVVPNSNHIIHDVVPNYNHIVHDVVPDSNHMVHDVVSDFASHQVKSDAPGMVGHTDIAGIYSKLMNRSININNGKNGAHITAIPKSFFPQLTDEDVNSPRFSPAERKCGLQQEPFVMFQYSDVSYKYPKSDIMIELANRPQIRDGIFALGTRGRFRGKYHLKPSMDIYKNRVKRQVNSMDGCQGSTLTLRRFYAYDNYCWVINPLYQDIAFHNCGHGCASSRDKSTLSRCEASYVLTPVWAYCAGLNYGGRIVKLSLPMPVECRCKTHQCS